MVFTATAKIPKAHICTPPCFKPPGGGILRTKPMAATFFTTAKSNDRLAQLWEDLLADPVPPHPSAEGWKTVGARFEMNMEPVHLIGTDKPKSESRRWRVDLAKLFHS